MVACACAQGRVILFDVRTLSPLRELARGTVDAIGLACSRQPVRPLTVLYADGRLCSYALDIVAEGTTLSPHQDSQVRSGETFSVLALPLAMHEADEGGHEVVGECAAGLRIGRLPLPTSGDEGPSSDEKTRVRVGALAVHVGPPSLLARALYGASHKNVEVCTLLGALRVSTVRVVALESEAPVVSLAVTVLHEDGGTTACDDPGVVLLTVACADSAIEVYCLPLLDGEPRRILGLTEKFGTPLTSLGVFKCGANIDDSFDIDPSIGGPGWHRLHLVTAGPAHLLVREVSFDHSSPATVRRLHKEAPTGLPWVAMCCRPAGSVFLAASDMRIVELEVSTGQCLSQWQLGRSGDERRLGGALDISPSGKLLAASVAPSPSAVAQDVLVIDAVSGDSLMDLRGHVAAIRGVAFTEGGRLASVGFDGVLLAWRLHDVSAKSASVEVISQRADATQALVYSTKHGGVADSTRAAEHPFDTQDVAIAAAGFGNTAKSGLAHDLASEARALRLTFDRLMDRVRDAGGLDALAATEAERPLVEELAGILEVSDGRLRPLLYPPHPLLAAARANTAGVANAAIAHDVGGIR
eukprot:TRINITY_DN70326_c0_g1_i1.p1 TRINITY_DN70326_c0_g1~~TRINITY_DN70326_c0_g1_i1.p1  ORF type:complete len:656 (+),score=98.63 TRINITY_DN70326_c0_g1_i1:219-1970(+)